MNLYIEFLGLFLSIATLTYVILGGMDFGYGILQLFSPQYRPQEYQQIIARKFAPIWEINHTWLIGIVVLLFVVFPKAFQLLVNNLSIPIMLFMFILITRGAGFALYYYDKLTSPKYSELCRITWGGSSLICSYLVGAIIGSVISGLIIANPENYNLSNNIFNWFSVLSGLIMVVINTVSAITSINTKNTKLSSFDLSNHFNLIGTVSLVLLIISSTTLLIIGWINNNIFIHNLLSNTWSLIWAISLILGYIVLLGLWLNNKLCMAFSVNLLLTLKLFIGLLFMQAPYIVPNIYTIHNAIDNMQIVEWVAPVLFVGSLILIPAIIYLYIIFNRREQSAMEQV